MGVVALPPSHEADQFLAAIRDGVGVVNAGIAVGWTPRRIDQLLSDPDFSELVEVARTCLYEDVEEVVYQKAKAGNRWAAEMVLFNRRRDHWAPPTQKHEIRRHEVHESIVVSVVGSVAQLLQEHGAAALQPGGVLDVDEAPEP